jgi:hypothetical protein
MNKSEWRSFFWAGRRGFTPAHFAIYGLLFASVGIGVMISGHLIGGVVILAFGVLTGYQAAVQQRRNIRANRGEE